MSCIKNCVYRFLDKDGNVLYVGSTQNLNYRVDNHSHLCDECYKKAVRVEYIEFNTLTDARVAEFYFINKYKPIHNTHYKHDGELSISILEFDDREWQQYPQFKGFKHKYEGLDWDVYYKLNSNNRIVRLINGYIAKRVTQQEQIMENEEEK